MLSAWRTRALWSSCRRSRSARWRSTAAPSTRTSQPGLESCCSDSPPSAQSPPPSSSSSSSWGSSARPPSRPWYGTCCCPAQASSGRRRRWQATACDTTPCCGRCRASSPDVRSLRRQVHNHSSQDLPARHPSLSELASVLVDPTFWDMFPKTWEGWDGRRRRGEPEKLNTKDVLHKWGRDEISTNILKTVIIQVTRRDLQRTIIIKNYILSFSPKQFLLCESQFLLSAVISPELQNKIPKIVFLQYFKVESNPSKFVILPFSWSVCTPTTTICRQEWNQVISDELTGSFRSTRI